MEMETTNPQTPTLKIGEYYQQGDVILRRIAQLPTEGITKAATKVLQEGETTGHMHQFDAGAAVQLYTCTDLGLLNGGQTIYPGIGKFIVVNEPSELRHEEHRAFKIAPGIYEMDLIREFNYDSYETERVRD